MADIKDLGPLLTKALEELHTRARCVKRNREYTRGCAVIPRVITDTKLTNAYKLLMTQSQAPWASVAVDSVQDRLEVGGIRTGDRKIEEAVWSDIWQGNGLDGEAKLVQHSILRDGRAVAIIWPDRNDQPEIVYEAADQVVVLYEEGRHQQRHRRAAVRCWTDSETDRENVTIYTPRALYKLREAREQTEAPMRFQAAGKWWEQREEIGRDGQPEPWPLPNPIDVLPAVEIATNRELCSGPFPYARGEFEHCHGLLDRIQLLTFLGLVVALWMGFPLRYLIGDKILRDDDGNAIQPFESKPDQVVQLENPAAKIGQLDPADRKNLSIFGELQQFAYVTKTPAHYFPNETGFSNISADMIRALEGGLHAKTRGIHKPQIGAGHEEVLRVAGLMHPDEIILPQTAEIVWLDHESRSMAERLDAAVKAQTVGLPWPMIAEMYLGMTQEAIGRAESQGAGQQLAALVAAANTPSNTTSAEPPA